MIRRVACTVAAATCLVAGGASAQRPQWDPSRHVLVVTSPLDSSDAHAALVAAVRAEGLEIEQSDTARGRIITVRRPSDSFGSVGGTVVYAAMVRRAPGGGCLVYFGGLIRANPNTRLGADPGNFARRGDPSTTREGSDLFFLSPGSASEWRRLERIADQVQRAGQAAGPPN